LHFSPVVHKFASSQAGVPVLTGFEHWPVAAEQVPAVWHWSRAVHIVIAVPAVHTPATQVLLAVHILLSLHVVPSAAAGFEQMPVAAAQAPAV
jgi:hypothetical protein